jgi:Helix-turn-helix domain
MEKNSDLTAAIARAQSAQRDAPEAFREPPPESDSEIPRGTPSRPHSARRAQRFWSEAQVAKYLRLSEEDVVNAARAGKLPYTDLDLDGVYRFDPDRLRSWIDTRFRPVSDDALLGDADEG